jgi:hypothetical protein
MLVGAVALHFGLAALVNAVPPAPHVVTGADHSAGSFVQAVALAAATATYWYIRRCRSQQRYNIYPLLFSGKYSPPSH